MSEKKITTALVVVSHSETLASGVVELASQMAADVRFLPAAGRDDGGIGTSYEKIEQAVTAARAAELEVVVLTDLGSATMTVESVLEFYEDEPVFFADAPLVEGAVAAAVAAQQGKPARQVWQEAVAAGQLWGSAEDGAGEDCAGDGDGEPAGAGAEARGSAGDGAAAGDSAGDGTAKATVTVGEPDGLHARPAALLAQLVNNSGEEVLVNGIEANSVMSLMAAGIHHGDEVTVEVSGPHAEETLAQITDKLTNGFAPS
ncbi:MAG: dihydroxyacetone kinase phosphoryl donor subunit DhaM [Actinomycetaceae bacterium]|nr:dihydroxyacetone kinase phosphoryl donor subunit DhaM [Actinomycetaceae bacterium]